MIMNNNKKILLPSIIAIVALLTLVIGATFAYISVESVDKSQTTTGSATFPAMGAVAIANGPNLSLVLTRPLLMNAGEDKTYYATTNGVPTESQTEKPAIGTITVTGPGTFTCHFTLHVTMLGNLYSTFATMEGKSNDQLILSVNNSDYDFNSNTDFTNGFDVSGSFSGLTEESPQNITAQFRFINKKDVIQDALADKTVTFTFSVTSFTCDANF